MMTEGGGRKPEDARNSQNIQSTEPEYIRYHSEDSHHTSHHHHSGRHHRRHHRRHRRNIESLSQLRRIGNLKFLLGALVLAVTLGVVIVVAGMLDRSRPVPESTAADTPARRLWSEADTVDFDQGLYGFDHRMESFLFVGTDDSGNEYPAEGETYHGAMADFLLLMVLDYTEDTYGFLQLDRNTITEIEMIGADGESHGFQDMQICTAHWYGKNQKGSAENTVTAVSTLLGYLENIRGYYVLNMDDVGVINRAVDGVEVTIEDDLSDTDPELAKGSTVTLTDEQAERFLRARMNVGGGTNVERMARQRAYMSSFFAKVGDLTRKKATFYNQLWNDIHTAGVTNMNGNAFSRIANMLMKGENKGVFTLEGTATEGMALGDDVLHEEFYPTETAVFDVMNQLYPLILIEKYEEEDEEESEYDAVPEEEDTEYPEDLTEDETDETEAWEELFDEDEETESEPFEYEYETGIDWEEDETESEMSEPAE